MIGSSGPPVPLGLLDIGPIEFLILAAAAIMLFGGDLPDVARKAGRIMGRLRTAARDLSRELDAPQDLPRLPQPGPGRREDRPDADADAAPNSPGATGADVKPGEAPAYEPGDPHAPPPTDATRDAPSGGPDRPSGGAAGATGASGPRAS